MTREPFHLAYSPSVYDHLAAIDAKYDSFIRQKTVEQLTYGRHLPSTVGPNNRFRVFYQIDYGSRKVLIVAIGVKDRNRLFVGGEEVTL